MTTLPAPTTDFTKLSSDLETFGYCLMPNALDSSLLAAVRERLTAQAKAEAAEGVAYTNPGHESNQWVNMLLNKGVEFEWLATHTEATALVSHLLGEDYLISCVDAQIKHPGDPAMPLHTDQWWMPPPVYPHKLKTPPGAIKRTREGTRQLESSEPMIAPTATANIMWMVSDFTADNGATLVVPKSHLSGAQPDGAMPHPIKTVQALGTAGTALIFDGRVWHAAGENRSQHTRYGITCNFCGPQFRPLENYTRGLRPEVMARASPLLLRRLGFKAWSTYGHTGDPDVDVAIEGPMALGPLGGDG